VLFFIFIEIEIMLINCINYFFIIIIYHIYKNGNNLITQGYNKFVQVGRVARINYGPQEGKIVTIVDVLNDKRVLVDGEDIARQLIPVRRLQLTSQVINVGRGARTGKLRKIIAKENVAKKFAESQLGRSFARQQRRQNLTDFERYKVLVLRRKLSKLTRAKPKK
jgi:large subunit ribosomal protein L14e